MAQIGCSNMEKSHKSTGLLSSISCDSCLHLLIHSATIDPDLKNKLAINDGIQNDHLLIKIYHENEAEPGAIVDAADGFLSIDLKNRVLYKVIIEEDTLAEVKCDTALLNYYIVHCSE